MVLGVRARTWRADDEKVRREAWENACRAANIVTANWGEREMERRVGRKYAVDRWKLAESDFAAPHRTREHGPTGGRFSGGGLTAAIASSSPPPSTNTWRGDNYTFFLTTIHSIQSRPIHHRDLQHEFMLAMKRTDMILLT